MRREYLTVMEADGVAALTVAYASRPQVKFLLPQPRRALRQDRRRRLDLQHEPPARGREHAQLDQITPATEFWVLPGTILGPRYYYKLRQIATVCDTLPVRCSSRNIVAHKGLRSDLT